MCLKKGKNVLIEIRFSKNLWTLRGVKRMQFSLMLDGMLADDNNYTEWYKIIYHDIRLFKNVDSVPDVRNRLVMIYGDKK